MTATAPSMFGPELAELPMAALGEPPAAPPSESYLPVEPMTLEATGLLPTDVESLALKLLLTSGPTVGRRIAEQIRLPFGIVTEQLRAMKAQFLVNITKQGAMGDFEYELTEDGHKRAHWHADRCTYCGAAPVQLDDYVASIYQQSIRKVKLRMADLEAAFEDMILSPAILSQLGQAVHAGRGLLLYGPPGNGKTSMAQRLLRSMSQHVWIPRTITIGGEIIRLFDPASHQEAPPTSPQSQWLDPTRYDRRWVRIRRPLVMVGGELRLEQLEITHNPATGILESPVQLKSNGGVLVVDDFGRQRCSIAELLNRWIIPLEMGQDFLSLPSGRQIQVPFEQLLVFSTNVQPHKLVDEAILRRIPYKIEVPDPTPGEFRELVGRWCRQLGVEYHDDAVDYLLARHFTQRGRPLRFCQPRDLIQQVRALCEFHEQPLVLTPQALDVAVKNYYAGL